MANSTAGSVSSGRHTRSQQRRQQQWGGGSHTPGGVYSEHEVDHRHHHHQQQQQQGDGRMNTRSQSLTALQPAVIQPRITRLETLEAKMASIEVSLSNTPRRRKAPSPSITTSNKENTVNINTPKNRRNKQDLENREREDKLNKLRTEAENKKMIIKNIRLALDRLDITDNIDVRIRQAELEYQLGREELNLLTVSEEARRLQEEVVAVGGGGAGPGGGAHADHSLHALLALRGGARLELLAAEAPWDCSSGPRFGVALRPPGPGLAVEWAAEGCDLRRGDRIIEVNGRLVPNIGREGSWSREDFARALATRPAPAQLVLLRAIQTRGESSPGALEVAALRQELGAVRAGAEEARRAKDGLRADNLRLTHRISYLEEQVQELLDRHTETQRKAKSSSNGELRHGHGPEAFVKQDRERETVRERERQRHSHAGCIESRRLNGTRSPQPQQPLSCVTSVVDLGSGEVVQVYQKSPRSVSGVSSRSVRSLDLEADYASEPSPASRHRGCRPAPPKKPLRLSLHRRAQSLQSVDGSPPTPPPPAVPPTPATPEHQLPRKRTHRECTQGALRWTTGVSRASRTQGNKWS